MLSQSLPTRLDFQHYKGDNFSRTLLVKDSLGADFNFTGYSATAKVVSDFVNNTLVATINVTLSAGEIALNIDESVVALLTNGTYNWYLTLTNTLGEPKTWFNGCFELNKGNIVNEQSETLEVNINDTIVTVTVNLYDVALEYKEAILKLVLTGTTLELDSVVHNKIGGDFTLSEDTGYYYILNDEDGFGANADKVVSQFDLLDSEGEWVSFVNSGSYIDAGTFKINSLAGKDTSNTYLLSIKVYN